MLEADGSARRRAFVGRIILAMCRCNALLDEMRGKYDKYGSMHEK